MKGGATVRIYYESRLARIELNPADYDALTKNPTAETILGDETLKAIVQELEGVRKNISIDWQLKESVQAAMRVMIKRIPRRYKYPPDDPSTGDYTISVNKVIMQAELFADKWNFGKQLPYRSNTLAID